MVRLILGFGLYIIATMAFAGNDNSFENIRFSVDVASRSTLDDSQKNIRQLNWLGFDAHKVFSDDKHDWGYGVFQLYYTQIDFQAGYPPMFESPQDKEWVVREFYLSVNMGDIDKPRLRIGHFTLPFGLESDIATNGEPLDYNLGRKLGLKVDWGLQLEHEIRGYRYNISYTFGGGHEINSLSEKPAVVGRIAKVNDDNFLWGFSGFHQQHPIGAKRRVSMDAVYYYGKWGVLGEYTWGSQNQIRDQFITLETNYTPYSANWFAYLNFFRQVSSMTPSSNKWVLGSRHKLNQHWEISGQLEHMQFSSQSKPDDTLLTLQFRFRS